MPVKNLVIILLTAVVSLICYETAQRNRYASTFVEAMEIVENEALEPYSQRELFNAAMNGMLQQIDEHSAFIDPEAYPAFKENLDQEFAGIGITASMSPSVGRLMVLSPTVGTPAYRAGIQAGDIILEVDGDSTEGLNLDDSVKLLRGKPGTNVALKLGRANVEEPIDVTLTRQVILIDSVLGDTRNPDGSWNFVIEDHPQIGYIRLTTFGERSASEMRETLSKMIPRTDALILDLRDNAGGLLNAAVEIADMFLGEGMNIVSTRGRDGQVREEHFARGDRTVVPRQMPVVVLTNRFSASASEILAAALQDHGRAVVIGERSWGKGTVQNVIELENGRSVMKLTTASYWRPSEKNIHRQRNMTENDDWGVRPNDGMKIDLTIEEYQELATWRRDRDYPDALGDEANDENGNEGGGNENGEDNGESNDSGPNGNGENGEGTTGDNTNGDSTSDGTATPSAGPSDPPGASVGSYPDPHVARAVQIINEMLGRTAATTP